jgi:Flp pilus assembly pilin Flp
MNMLASMQRNGRDGASKPGLLARFAADDAAFDIVEYALLAAFLGLAGYGILLSLPSVMGTTYSSWLDTNNGVPGKWDPPEPAGS